MINFLTIPLALAAILGLNDTTAFAEEPAKNETIDLYPEEEDVYEDLTDEDLHRNTRDKTQDKPNKK